MHMLLVTAVAALSLGTVSFADSQKEKVLSYFKENVLGKTVTAKQTSEDEDFEQRWTYSELKETKNGFTFDETVEIKQNVYALDENGKRKGEPSVRDRKQTAHTEVRYIESQDRLRGYKRMLNSDFSDVTGKAYDYEITAIEDGLETKWTDITPVEWPARPPAEGNDLLLSTHTEKLSVNESGKLVRKFTQRTSILDPKTEKVLSEKPEWSTTQTEE